MEVRYFQIGVVEDVDAFLLSFVHDQKGWWPNGSLHTSRRTSNTRKDLAELEQTSSLSPQAFSALVL